MSQRAISMPYSGGTGAGLWLGAVALNGWRGVGLGRGPRGKAGAVLILDMNSNWAPGAQ